MMFSISCSGSDINAAIFPFTIVSSERAYSAAIFCGGYCWYYPCLCFSFTLACLYSNIFYWYNSFYLTHLSSYLFKLAIFWSGSNIDRELSQVTLAVALCSLKLASLSISHASCSYPIKWPHVLLNDLTYYHFFLLSDIVTMHPTLKNMVWSVLFGSVGTLFHSIVWSALFGSVGTLFHSTSFSP